jgi:hypothetical protein
MTTKPVAPKSPKIPKKPRDEAIEIMRTEMRGMIPTFLICNAVALLACVVYGIVVSAFEWQFLTGLLLGNAAALGNFYFLGAKSAKIIRRKDRRFAQMYTTGMFFVRYLGAFAVFGVLIRLDVINPYTAVVPLFYPKIHYTIKAIFNKEV